jgi:hypothetical protein
MEDLKMSIFAYFGIPILLIAVALAMVYRRWVWTNTDPLTKWLQIVALIVAAYWAYSRFTFVEAPSLEPIVIVTSKLYRSEPNPIPSTCIVTFQVIVRNEGSVSFDVKGVDVRGWPFIVDKPNSSLPTYVDVGKIQGLKPIVDAPSASLHSQYLIGHYSPKSARDETFSWIFAAPTASSYLFEADVKGSDDKILRDTRLFSLGICDATTHP